MGKVCDKVPNPSLEPEIQGTKLQTTEADENNQVFEFNEPEEQGNEAVPVGALRSAKPKNKNKNTNNQKNQYQNNYKNNDQNQSQNNNQNKKANKGKRSFLDKNFNLEESYFDKPLTENEWKEINEFMDPYLEGNFNGV